MLHWGTMNGFFRSNSSQEMRKVINSNTHTGAEKFPSWPLENEAATNAKSTSHMANQCWDYLSSAKVLDTP